MKEGEAALEAKARGTIDRYGMLSGGERVIVSVSGGPDSVALLLCLASMAPALGLELAVFHLDHMFRGEVSADDASFVERLAGGMGVPSHIVTVDIPSLVLRGQSAQDIARSVRLEKLYEYADEIGADRIAIGHTADDQVETLLMRLVQGAGLTGLGGMEPVRDRIIRPLIEVWKHEVESYLEDRGVEPRRDESNLDEKYLRNRIRAKLVPLLVDEFGESVREVLLREVESLSLDRGYLSERGAEAFSKVATVRTGEVRLERDGLLALHPALERMVLREAWSTLLPGMTSLSWTHLRDVIEKVVAGGTGAALDLPGGAVVEREYGELVFRLAVRGMEPPGPVVLEGPGKVMLPGTGTSLEVGPVEAGDVSFSGDPNVEYVRPDTEFPLEVRAIAPGDRFRPLGSPGTRKLGDFLTDRKVPRRERSGRMVVVSKGEIVWVVGLRLDERFRLERGEKSALRLRVVPDGEYDDPAGGREEI